MVDTIPSTTEDIAEVITEVTDEVAEIDADDLADVVAEIDESGVSDLASATDTLTLAQVQEPFETYFVRISEMLFASGCGVDSTPGRTDGRRSQTRAILCWRSPMEASVLSRRGGFRGGGRRRGGRGGRRGLKEVVIDQETAKPAGVHPSGESRARNRQ